MREGKILFFGFIGLFAIILFTQCTNQSSQRSHEEKNHYNDQEREIKEDEIRLRLYISNSLYDPTSIPLSYVRQDSVIDIVIPSVTDGIQWIYLKNQSIAFEVEGEKIYVSFRKDTISIQGALIIANTMGENEPGVMTYDLTSINDTLRYSFTSKDELHAVRTGLWTFFTPSGKQELFYDYEEAKDNISDKN